jgi:hypothetical protein
MTNEEQDDEAVRLDAATHAGVDAILSAHPSCVTDAQNFDKECLAVQSGTKQSDALHGAGVGMLVGAGALAVATGVYLVWPAPRVTIVPTAGTSGAGLLLNGSF